MGITYLDCFQTLSRLHDAALSLKRFPDNLALRRLKLSHRSHSLTCSAGVPKQNDLRNFLMSEECAEMAQKVASLAWR
jgi:hypothetical protein